MIMMPHDWPWSSPHCSSQARQTSDTPQGWWWADPAAGYVLVFYAAREVWEIFFTPD